LSRLAETLPHPRSVVGSREKKNQQFIVKVGAARLHFYYLPGVESSFCIFLSSTGRGRAFSLGQTDLEPEINKQNSKQLSSLTLSSNDPGRLKNIRYIVTSTNIVW
jgi:hypothetical protein